MVNQSVNCYTKIDDTDQKAIYIQHGSDENLINEKPIPRLNFIDGIAIIVGIIIGSGIFSSPGLALERSGSPGLLLVSWVASGSLVILAAYCYIELGSMMPSAGGDYDYLQRAYGDRAAFSFAWFNFFVAKTGSQAIIATVFGRYFGAVLTGDTSSIRKGFGSEETSIAKISSILMILFITLLNCIGIKESSIIQIILTSSKVMLVCIVFIFSLVYTISADSSPLKDISIFSAFEGSKGFMNFGNSMIACLWCFDGWADANFLQEELIDPRKDLSRITLYGLAIVTTCYVLMNVSYLTVLSKQEIIHSNAIVVDYGSTVAKELFGTSKAALFLPLLLAGGVALSTAGSANGSIMTGGRAFYAVARNGKAPAVLASLNSSGSPWAALLAQGGWAIALIAIPGSNFASLLSYFGPTSWLFYAFTASAVITLRLREPEAYRPFKVPFYPIPPLVIIFAALSIVISSLTVDPLFTLLSMGFVMLSFPVHYFFIENVQSNPHRPSAMSMEEEEFQSF